MKKNLILIAIFSLLLLACSKNVESRYTQPEEEDMAYICPMDCEDGKTYDKEGECPVCGMALDEPEEED